MARNMPMPITADLKTLKNLWLSVVSCMHFKLVHIYTTISVAELRHQCIGVDKATYCKAPQIMLIAFRQNMYLNHNQPTLSNCRAYMSAFFIVKCVQTIPAFSIAECCPLALGFDSEICFFLQPSNTLYYKIDSEMVF